MTPEDDAERAATEATFREANERIREAEKQLQPPLERVPFLCECDEVSCHEPIPMTPAAYEDLRSDPTLFAVLRGHASRDELVAEHPAYLVVRKTAEAAEVARALDPRKGAA